jgi:hypothetical protein
MPKADPTTGRRPENTRRSASHWDEVSVAGLLRDCIVGITCFPDPLPRGRQRRSPRWRRTKHS